MAISIGIGNYIRNKGHSKALPSWVADSIEFWYDVKKQGATNESLAVNPYLVDFAHSSKLPVGYIDYGMYDTVEAKFYGNSNITGSFTGKIKEGSPRPLKLYNFAFSAGSGIDPAYPNALVTDGVDDYGVVQNMDYGVKTLFIVVNPQNLYAIIYDQRERIDIKTFAIYIDRTIAYNSWSKGLTYINGVENNTIYANTLQNTKHIVTIQNDNVTENNSVSPTFFSSTTQKTCAKTAFYSAIGFNRTLTQEEIDWVIANMIDTSDIAPLNPIVLEDEVSFLTECNKPIITETY